MRSAAGHGTGRPDTGTVQRNETLGRILANKLDDLLGRSIMVDALWVSHVWIINEVFYSRYVELQRAL
jgi:hypothetical protein